MPGTWVTAGAPLASGDGWRVWYSWPAGAFTPRTPRVQAMIQELVKLHGGTISVTSEEGVGTTFVIRLPGNPEFVYYHPLPTQP